jgi:hypothetical protein
MRLGLANPIIPVNTIFIIRGLFGDGSFLQKFMPAPPKKETAPKFLPSGWVRAFLREVGKRPILSLPPG